ncbi:acyl-CoA carboxylase subunit epsilon [Nocardia pseudobrasiliensis]|uniref:Acyl-CoA carboxylase epsilon subunit-like protein n=1 Tax=Nocardia pseudobrasiliensis TaxID=45979 RepID=A0A370I0K6_9NOCA|nr:acyl-CoA carboxylase subunit epsilon [Nocardia pseudobrasiliensis]RDI64285.1 acyl-CoA carboxylase epsilon subunit-like protein [Nocardia pseudobrasiliensis]
MTAVADEEILRAAELDLSVDDLVAVVPVDADTESHEGPVIRILKGAPTDDEIAALVCVLAAAAASAEPASESRGPADLWGRPTFLHRGTSPFSPYSFPYLSHLRD